MTIKEYTKEYTAGRPIHLTDILSEIKELVIELAKLDKNGVKEEFQDVLLFFQAYLYWRFGINGEIWKMAKNSAQKFAQRKQVWQKIYIKVGLSSDISGYVGNYKKLEKVIGQLENYGVNKNRAEEVWRKIVLEDIDNVK